MLADGGADARSLMCQFTDRACNRDPSGCSYCRKKGLACEYNRVTVGNLLEGTSSKVTCAQIEIVAERPQIEYKVERRAKKEE